VNIPSVDELEGKSVDELKELMNQWGPLYSKRFEIEKETREEDQEDTGGEVNEAIDFTNNYNCLRYVRISSKNK
jgi:hypothetical protein